MFDGVILITMSGVDVGIINAFCNMLIPVNPVIPK